MEVLTSWLEHQSENKQKSRPDTMRDDSDVPERHPDATFMSAVCMPFHRAIKRVLLRLEEQASSIFDVATGGIESRNSFLLREAKADKLLDLLR